MPKVKFLKDHLQHKAGDVAQTTHGEANYFIRCGVAEKYVEDAPEAQPENSIEQESEKVEMTKEDAEKIVVKETETKPTPEPVSKQETTHTPKRGRKKKDGSV